MAAPIKTAFFRGYYVTAIFTLPAAPGTKAVKSTITVASRIADYGDAIRLRDAVFLLLKGIENGNPTLPRGWAPFTFGTDVKDEFDIVDVPVP